MRSDHHPRHPVQDRDALQNRRNGLGRRPRTAPDTTLTTADSADTRREALAATKPLKLLRQQFAELRGHASLYAGARIDSAKACVRDAITRTLLAALGFVALSGLIVIASWFALSGAAHGLGTLFGERWWIGSLLTGIAALASVGAGLCYVVANRRERARKRMVEKYAARHARQRTRIGPDAHDRRAASDANGE